MHKTIFFRFLFHRLTGSGSQSTQSNGEVRMGQNGGSPQHSQVEFVEELRNDARLYLIRLIRELALLRYLGDYLNQDDPSFNTDSSYFYNYILNTVTTTQGEYIPYKSGKYCCLSA